MIVASTPPALEINYLVAPTSLVMETGLPPCRNVCNITPLRLTGYLATINMLCLKT